MTSTASARTPTSSPASTACCASEDRVPNRVRHRAGVLDRGARDGSVTRPPATTLVAGPRRSAVAHRRMIANPRYGRIGMVVMPYYLVFESLGPMIELVGVASVIVGLAFGLLDVRFAVLLFAAVAIGYGLALSLTALAPAPRALVPAIPSRWVIWRRWELLRYWRTSAIDNSTRGVATSRSVRLRATTGGGVGTDGACRFRCRSSV